MADLLEWRHQGKTFIGTPQQFVDEIAYSSYRHNRIQCPYVKPSQFVSVYGECAQVMEQRYQQEMATSL